MNSIIELLVTLFGASGFISLAMAIFTIVCNWKIFAKAGEKGWKSIVPIYNSYTLFKLSWEVKHFWRVLISSVIASLLTLIASIIKNASGIDNTIAILLVLIVICIYISLIIINIKLALRTALAFGKTKLFGYGLFFLGVIFNAILAFGSAAYVGPILDTPTSPVEPDTTTEA